MSEVAEGGCECGAVRYRMDGPPIMVNCCHCRDCQRITGSAFALNAMIETGRITTIRGEPVIASLAREGSGETRAWRCGTCQTLLWADHPRMGDGLRFLRTGTLDHAEALAPDAHFFVRSRHPWLTIPDDCPAFETLPAKETGMPLDAARTARLREALRSGN